MTPDIKLLKEFERLDAELLKRYGSRSLYEALGVKPDASAEEISSHYLEKARKYHPDINKSDHSEQRMKDINNIMDILSNPKKRAAYDVWLKVAGVKEEPQSPRPNKSAHGGGETSRGSFRSGRSEGGVFVNGVRLPTELFRGATVINNIAVSSDGRLYARVSGGKAEINGMPGGILRVDDLEIRYESGRLTVTGRGIHNASVSASGSVYMNEDSIVIDFAKSRGNNGQGGIESVVEKAYDGVRLVLVDNSIEGVILGLSQDGKVYVNGSVTEQPLYADGRLSVTGLEGKLLLPEGYSVQFNIRTSSGDVKGDVAHQGIIETTHNGDIKLSLYSPLNVVAKARVGVVSVKGMVLQGNGIYIPPDAKSSGTLGLETLFGDIRLDYQAKAAGQRAKVHAR